MQNAKVRQFILEGGKTVKNQFILETDDGRYFQSYESVIAFIPNNGDKIQLDENYWDYSKTTAKYRNNFLNMDTDTIKKKLNNGEILFAKLNEKADL